VKRVALVLLVIALGGCERSFRDMYDQPRYKPLAGSRLWSDGRASRDTVGGTVPHAAGTFAGSSSGRLDLSTPSPAISPLAALRDELRPAAGNSTAQPAFAMPPITADLLARGRERFDVFCSPCHSIVGDGDGFVARRGFPHPPSYHTDRLRAASDAHLYAVISDGYGAMYPYATRLSPSDRLAVVAYIRALQLSQHAPVDALPPAERAALEAAR
jgi:mono/diheme cytochrome c family protein